MQGSCIHAHGYLVSTEIRNDSVVVVIRATQGHRKQFKKWSVRGCGLQWVEHKGQFFSFTVIEKIMVHFFPSCYSFVYMFVDNFFHLRLSTFFNPWTQKLFLLKLRRNCIIYVYDIVLYTQWSGIWERCFVIR